MKIVIRAIKLTVLTSLMFGIMIMVLIKPDSVLAKDVKTKKLQTAGSGVLYYGYTNAGLGKKVNLEPKKKHNYYKYSVVVGNRKIGTINKKNLEYIANGKGKQKITVKATPSAKGKGKVKGWTKIYTANQRMYKYVYYTINHRHSYDLKKEFKIKTTKGYRCKTTFISTNKTNYKERLGEKAKEKRNGKTYSTHKKVKIIKPKGEELKFTAYNAGIYYVELMNKKGNKYVKTGKNCMIHALPWIAHRGLRSKIESYKDQTFKQVYIENTKEAFKGAAEAGAYAIETDIRFTKDKVMVCAHDDNLKYAYGLNNNYKISKNSYDEINTYLKGIGQVDLAKFVDYLDVCGKHDIVPVIEIKLPDPDPMVIPNPKVALTEEQAESIISQIAEKVNDTRIPSVFISFDPNADGKKVDVNGYKANVKASINRLKKAIEDNNVKMRGKIFITANGALGFGKDMVIKSYADFLSLTNPKHLVWSDSPIVNEKKGTFSGILWNTSVDRSIATFCESLVYDNVDKTFNVVNGGLK